MLGSSSTTSTRAPVATRAGGSATWSFRRCSFTRAGYASPMPRVDLSFRSNDSYELAFEPAERFPARLPGSDQSSPPSGRYATTGVCAWSDPGKRAPVRAHASFEIERIRALAGPQFRASRPAPLLFDRAVRRQRAGCHRLGETFNPTLERLSLDADEACGSTFVAPADFDGVMQHRALDDVELRPEPRGQRENRLGHLVDLDDRSRRIIGHELLESVDVDR